VVEGRSRGARSHRSAAGGILQKPGPRRPPRFRADAPAAGCVCDASGAMGFPCGSARRIRSTLRQDLPGDGRFFVVGAGGVGDGGSASDRAAAPRVRAVRARRRSRQRRVKSVVACARRNRDESRPKRVRRGVERGRACFGADRQGSSPTAVFGSKRRDPRSTRPIFAAASGGGA